MNILRRSLGLSALFFLSGCFSYQVVNKSRVIERQRQTLHENQVKWEPFQGSRLLRCPFLCTRGKDTSSLESVYRLDIADSALFLAIGSDAATIQDYSGCKASDASGRALDLVITSDTIDFHPTDTGKFATARLYLDIRESAYERERFDLRYTSLSVSSHGRVEALPVNIRTSPDGRQEAAQAASLHQLWLFASIPADIVTSPLQLIAAPFVIPLLGLGSSRW